jgi:hypothetical protein
MNGHLILRGIAASAATITTLVIFQLIAVAMVADQGGSSHREATSASNAPLALTGSGLTAPQRKG